MLPINSSARLEVLRVFGSRPLPAYALTFELPVYTVGVTVPDTASLATPVFGTEGELLGALTISAPLSRLTPERVEGMKGPLNTAAGELTRALGGFFPVSVSQLRCQLRPWPDNLAHGQFSSH